MTVIPDDTVRFLGGPMDNVTIRCETIDMPWPPPQVWDRKPDGSRYELQTHSDFDDGQAKIAAQRGVVRAALYHFVKADR